MLITIFDTETTGKWDFKAGANAPHQPAMVQLAAKLVQLSHGAPMKTLASFSTMIKDGYDSIEPGAQAVHGISIEVARTYGLALKTVVALLATYFERSDLLVCHNYDFDSKIVDKGAFSLGLKLPERPSFCTMKEDKIINYCALPGNYGRFKWPKLIELHSKLFNCEFEDAHDAMGDVTATANCLNALVQRKIITLG